ncbi:MAG: PAS domain S-box protein [Candidatus Latescibacter sp.]|nr:PAS domain S-box protein [Candidatus Latescibacter sp.]
MEAKNKIKSQPVKELEGSGKRISEQEDSEKELTFQKNEYRLGIKNCDELTFEEMFRNYINIIPHFVMVVDEDHTILLANDIVLKVMGKKSEDVRGCYCPKLIHGLDSPFPGCPLEEAVEKGGYVEKELLDPFYNSWVSSAIYPTSFVTRDGKRVFLHLIRDITEQKKAEKALIESESKFRTIVETAPSMLIITDKEGKNIYVSPNCFEITGYSQEELLHKIVWWVHEDDTVKAKEIFDRSYREKKSVSKNFEYKAVKKNGDIWYASSSGAPVLDNEGNFCGYVIETLDITERMSAMEQLMKTKIELEIKSKNLEESNIALKVLLEHQVRNTKNTEKNILENIKTLVFPYLEKLKYSSLDESHTTLLNIIENNLSEIIKPFAIKLTNKAINFSPTEVRVAKMVKEGRTAKNIAEILHISENTVKEHNSQIRKKLGLKRKKINLRTYLQSFFEEQ